METLLVEGQIYRDGKNLQLSTKTAVYIRNGTREAHSYYG